MNLKIYVIMVSTLAATSATAGPTCTDQVNTAFRKLRTHGAFRMETKIVDARQGTLTLKVDYVLPDRMHQKVALGSDGMTMDTIAIGKQAWSNAGEGWRKLPASVAEKIAEQIKETVANDPTAKIEFKCRGETQFEGRSYYLFQGLLPSPLSSSTAANEPAQASANLQNVYVDKQSGLPTRNIVTSAAETDKRLFDGTFTLIDGLKIEQPSTAN